MGLPEKRRQTLTESGLIVMEERPCSSTVTRSWSSPTALSVAELGREAIPCKDWPSATASGGCGLDKGLPPDLVCHQQIDGEIHSQTQPASPRRPPISDRWFSTNFRPSLTEGTASATAWSSLRTSRVCGGRSDQSHRRASGGRGGPIC